MTFVRSFVAGLREREMSGGKSEDLCPLWLLQNVNLPTQQASKQTHLHCIANALNVRRCVTRLRTEDGSDAGFHQMTNALGSMKAILWHDSLDFSMQFAARQYLIVCINLLNGVLECNLLWVGRLVVVIWWKQSTFRAQHMKREERNLIKNRFLSGCCCCCCCCCCVSAANSKSFIAKAPQHERCDSDVFKKQSR